MLYNALMLVQHRVLTICIPGFENVCNQLSVPLVIIFKNSLETRSLPEMWLESIVLPLFKAKSRYDPGNY